MKACYIFNPCSGFNARNPHLLVKTRRFIKKNRLDAELVTTEHPLHARELAQRAVDRGCQLVVAIGGDGTMNEIASALVGTDTALGLIPAGSGNGLSRHLGIYGPEKKVFSTLLNGTTRCIDTGEVNGFPFFNAMGIGFDAEISHRFNQLTQRGLSAYIRTTTNAFFSYRPQTYKIQSGQQTLQSPAFIISVANSDQYGNNCFIAPGAQVDDGLLDLTVLKQVHLLNALPLAFRLFTKKIDGSPSVQRLRGSHFVIERLTPGLVHTDGETHQAGAVIDIIVRPRSLKIVTPCPITATAQRPGDD